MADTNAVIGNERCFYMTDTKGSGKFTWIGGEQSNNLNRSADTIEVSHKQTKWKEFLAGKMSATASVSCNLDDSASSAQRAMLASFQKGAKVFCFVGNIVYSSIFLCNLDRLSINVDTRCAFCAKQNRSNA